MIYIDSDIFDIVENKLFISKVKLFAKLQKIKMIIISLTQSLEKKNSVIKVLRAFFESFYNASLSKI